MSSVVQILFGIFLLGMAGLSGYFGQSQLRKGFENIAFDEKKRLKNLKSQLDATDLALLQNMNGLIFYVKSANTIRHLIDLQIVKNEVFPSVPVSFGYYLTDSGRQLLEKEFGKTLYPKIFCELLRVRYWEGYPKDFVKEKQDFEKKYKISWERSWKLLCSYLIQEIPQAKGDELTFLNSYLVDNSFDIVMGKIVRPWMQASVFKK